MKVNNKKFFALGLLSLFLFAFALQLVSANNNDTSIDDRQNPIGDWFTKWEKGQEFSANIAKYLFWVLVSVIVYSVVPQIPGLDSLKGWLGGIFSIIVGFLAMAYVTPDQVYALMNSYSALGFVLGGALPFLILGYFTLRLAADSVNKGPADRMFSRIFAIGLWVLFTVFMGIKAIYPQDPIDDMGVYYTLSWVLVGLGALGILSMAFVFEKVRGWLRMETNKKADETFDEAGNSLKNLANMNKGAGN